MSELTLLRTGRGKVILLRTVLAERNSLVKPKMAERRSAGRSDPMTDFANFND